MSEPRNKSRLGRLLMDAREGAGYTRTELFTRTGVPVPTIESWETGAMPPKGPQAVALYKLRRALRIDPLELEAAVLDLPATRPGSR